MCAEKAGAWGGLLASCTPALSVLACLFLQDALYGVEKEFGGLVKVSSTKTALQEI